MNGHFPGFFSIRARILGALLLLLLVILVFGLQALDRSQAARAESEIKGKLEASRKLLRTALARRQARMRSELGLLADEPAFRAAVAAQDPAAVEAELCKFQERSGLRRFG